MPWPATPHTLLVELYRYGAWVDVTAKWRVADGIRIEYGQTSGGGDTGEPAPAKCLLTLDALDGSLRRLPRDTPLRVTVNGVQRFLGTVFGRSLEWDPAHATAWVKLQGASQLARLRENDATLRSAPRRWIPTTSPVAYWAMDDGYLIQEAAGLPSGVAPLRPFVGLHPSGAVTGTPKWGRGELAPWLEPVISRTGSATLTILWSRVSMPGFAGTWTIDAYYNSGTVDDDMAVDVNPSYLGGTTGWPQLMLLPGTTEVTVSLNGLPEVGASVPALFDSQLHHVRWTCTQSGANVTYSVAVDGTVVLSSSASAFTLPAITTLGLAGGGPGQGHVGVWTTPPALATAASVAFGRRGETAGRRAERLCLEEGVPFVGVGDLDATATMGPQPSDLSLVEHLQACADADGALVYDDNTGTVVFRTRADTYNQAAALALDYPTRGHLAPPFVPVEDEQVVNDVTVTRLYGPKQQVQQTSGPLAVAVIGSRPATPTLNVETDEQAQHMAGWRVHRGTSGEARYEDVRVDLLSASSLAGAAVTVGIGDRLTVANLPPWCDLPTADMQAVGVVEVVGEIGWELTYNTVPYAPLLVGELGTGWLDSDTTTLTAGIDADDTSFQVTVGGALWTTDPAHFPVQIRVDGDEMTLTAVSGASSPQTFTVTRGSHASSHAAGATVRLAPSARIVVVP